MKSSFGNFEFRRALWGVNGPRMIRPKNILIAIPLPSVTNGILFWVISPKIIFYIFLFFKKQNISPIFYIFQAMSFFSLILKISLI